eukprot:COSAG02_NODE_1447_length_12575_cov_8.479400_7_plen_75_part_00
MPTRSDGLGSQAIAHGTSAYACFTHAVRASHAARAAGPRPAALVAYIPVLAMVSRLTEYPNLGVRNGCLDGLLG